MKYAVVHKLDADTLKAKDYLINKLNQNPSFVYDEINPQLVISIGGDGCMLRAVAKYLYLKEGVSFVGISSGNLGFLCDYQLNEIDEAIDSIINREPKYHSYRLLEMEYNNKTFFYLNDCVITEAFASKMYKVYINGYYFESIKANGLLFSTPLGSSGYNRSLGGALVHTKLSCFMMNEISPINNKAYHSFSSPIVLTDKDVITVESNFHGSTLGGDFSSYLVNEEIKKINIKLSTQSCIFAHYKHTNYYDRLKKGLI